MATDEPTSGPKPPYIPWTTFINLVDELGGKGLPDQIDRSVLKSKSGATQSQFLAAARFLDLIDRDDRPTERFKALASRPEDRKALVEQLVRDHYADALALGSAATQAQLDAKFRSYGLQGETARKAVGFFLNAARLAELPLSSHYQQTRPGQGGRRRGATGGGVRRQRSSRTENPGETPSPPPTGSDARERYIDLLLKKAEDDMDDALLDRIERVIGVETAERDERDSDED